MQTLNAIREGSNYDQRDSDRKWGRPGAPRWAGWLVSWLAGWLGTWV